MTTAPILYPSQCFHLGFLPGAEALNQPLLTAYRELGEADFERRTHFFGGRFENLYLDRARLPGLPSVLDQATAFAGEILGRAPASLRCGFWFNDMGPGQATTRHSHEELDELLSGVYYVEVPADSGELILFDRRMRTQVQPEAGMFVFFAPEVVHEVTPNRSAAHRLSIGMNFGPLEAEA